MELKLRPVCLPRSADLPLTAPDGIETSQFTIAPEWRPPLTAPDGIETEYAVGYCDTFGAFNRTGWN